MTRFAEALGHSSDVLYYQQTFQSLVQQYNKFFYHPDQKRYDIGVQSSWVLPLWLGAVPSQDYDTVISLLLADIEMNDNHLTTGILGTKYLMLVLSDLGRDDVAMEIMMQTDYPSWLFMITQNYEVSATTLWELWDSPVGSPGMDSRAHHMFGSVGYWFYRNLAGIQQSTDSVGFEKLQFVPPNDRALLYGTLSNITASINTIQGTVSSSWSSQGGIKCAPIVSGPQVWPSSVDCGATGGVIQDAWISPSCSEYAPSKISTQCAKLLSSCLGHQSCELVGIQEACGSSFESFSSSMKLVAQCTESPSFSWSVVVPPSSSSTVTLRKMGLANIIVQSIHENGTALTIWKNGNFFAVDKGVISATDDTKGNIVVQTLSGSYTFALTGTQTTMLTANSQQVARTLTFTCSVPSQTISLIAGSRIECKQLLGAQQSSNLLVHLVEQSCLGQSSCTFPLQFNDYAKGQTAFESCLASAPVSVDYFCS
jgi:hypothetical protein